jgi:anti-sigma regulatory factor (Ser/Thr protein kinase)
MMGGDSLQLLLAAVPESVGRARAAVADLGAGLGMREPRLGDLKTVVSEACSNVVRHAYPEEPGNFEVRASARGEGVLVVVRDFGIGMRPGTHGEKSGLRLGLGLISMLSSRYEILGHGDGGTELRAVVPITDTPDLEGAGGPRGRR